MKTAFLLLTLSLAVATLAPAQNAASGEEPLRTAEELDTLLGPVALYPDALIALILPAATEPSDVVLAARFLNAKSDAALIEQQPWDDSVKGLARYPEVVKWMDENLTWTKEVGEAFMEQPADVMKAIQRLRAKARASGALTDTPEQQIVVEKEDIRIVPARTEVIYVPRYDPAVVYVERRSYYSSAPLITFGVGCAAGYWLAYDCDWPRRTIWVVSGPDRSRLWRERRDWRHPSFPGRPGYIAEPYRRSWTPPAHHMRPRPDFQRPYPDYARPAPPVARVPNGWRDRQDHRYDRPDRDGRDGRADRDWRDGRDRVRRPQPTREVNPLPVAPPLTTERLVPQGPSWNSDRRDRPGRDRPGRDPNDVVGPVPRGRPSGNQAPSLPAPLPPATVRPAPTNSDSNPSVQPAPTPPAEERRPQRSPTGRPHPKLSGERS